MKRFSNITMAVFAAVLVISLTSGCDRLGSKSTAELLTTGTMLAREGKWEKAGDHAKAAVKKEPGNISAQLLLALTCENTGKRAQAIEAAIKAVEINEDNFLAQYTLGRLYVQDGKLQDSLKPLITANKLNPREVGVLVLLADVSMRMNAFNNAINYYNTIIRNHHEFMNNKVNASAIWNQLAVIYTRRNLVREAASSFKESYTLTPENPHVLLNFGIYFEHIKQSKRALAYYNKYLEVTSKNPELAPKQAKVKERIAKIAGQ